MIDPDTLDWVKMDGLIPAIVQHGGSGEVRMLGYMDRAALDATIRDNLVTFHSRSRGDRGARARAAAICSTWSISRPMRPRRPAGHRPPARPHLPYQHR